MSPALPVSVTGMGAITGAGGTLGESLDAIYAGRRTPAPPVRFSTDHIDTYPVLEILGESDDGRRGAEVDATHTLRTTELALNAATQALADAGLTPDVLAGRRVGVCAGTTVGCALNNEAFYRSYKKGGDPGPEAFARMLRSNPAEQVSLANNFNGPISTVVNACSSGTDAIGLGAEWIRAGICDVVLVGGADELCRFTYAGFISLMVTSNEPCRPFDGKRKGLNLGEGAAFLVLESEGSLKKRNVKPLAKVYGYGSGCDAHHLTAPHPEGQGLEAALDRAFEQWGHDQRRLSLINAHGTSTPENDRVEGKVLAGRLAGIPFHSTKGYTGHTLGAAGAIEAALTISFLQRGVAPGTVGFKNVDPAIGIAPLTENTELTGNFALSQSLAFGGSNSALILGVGR